MECLARNGLAQQNEKKPPQAAECPSGPIASRTSPEQFNTEVQKKIMISASGLASKKRKCKNL